MFEISLRLFMCPLCLHVHIKCYRKKNRKKNNYGFFSHAIFSFVRMRDHLATNVIITQDC